MQLGAHGANPGRLPNVAIKASFQGKKSKEDSRYGVGTRGRPVLSRQRLRFNCFEQRSTDSEDRTGHVR